MKSINKPNCLSISFGVPAMAAILTCTALASDHRDPVTTSPPSAGERSATTPASGPTRTPNGPTPGKDVSLPDNPFIKLPDLVPLTLECWRNPSGDLDDMELFGDAAHYMASVSVANYGTADADWFCGCFEFTVLETTDPVNWPVGKRGAIASPSFMNGAGVMEIVYGKYCYMEGFYVPKCVTKAEVVLIVDKYFKYLGGTPEHGRIVELDETNNVGQPVVITSGEE